MLGTPAKAQLHVERRKIMKQDRVLARIQARELTEKETQKVSGGIHTETVCTFNGRSLDGDVGEC
jgi:bacteriocin-like protein